MDGARWSGGHRPPRAADGRPQRPAGRSRRLRQVPRHRPGRRAENRRPRRVDGTPEAGAGSGRQVRAQGSRRHARPRRPGGPFGRRGEARGRVHDEFRRCHGGAAPVAVAAAAPAAADGKKVYDTACVACHATGVAGAPKFADKAAWAPRLKTGADALYASALKGKGAMPAKGGNAALSDAEVKASVDYMTAAAK
ncbi:MAG: cytochrome c5 family protein [Betaproteobacteria bacterium]|nr:cytochrome c5 family protein [Betaproteobacteria bacterium]